MLPPGVGDRGLGHRVTHARQTTHKVQSAAVDDKRARSQTSTPTTELGRTQILAADLVRYACSSVTAAGTLDATAGGDSSSSMPGFMGGIGLPSVHSL